MKKIAFTLTELMVALGVVGILCAVMLPIIFNLMPDQNIIMAKRVYYSIQETVADLINDDACYPDRTMSDYDARVGFDDGNAYPNCAGWSSDDKTSANEKFQTLFHNRLDSNELDSDGGFTTKDKVYWKVVFDNSTFDGTKNDATYYATIIVDVNGTNSSPNCGQSTDATECTDGRTKGFDKFAVKVYADGGLEIVDEWAKDAVGIDKDITNE